MVTLGKSIAEQLLSYCSSTLPEEACGALEGFVVDDWVYISGFIPVLNRSSQPETSFIFDAEEWVSIVLDPDLQLVGIFHSHPTGSAYPSHLDLQTAWYQLPVHLIVAIEKGELYAYNQNKNHSAAKSDEWFSDLNIRISPQE